MPRSWFLAVTAAIAATDVAFVHPVAALRVQGNRIVDDAGKVLHLHGASHSGSEYSCVQGHGILEGETDAAAVAAMAAWGINVVRVPLNEDCWLGINGVKPAMGGAQYQAGVKAYVDTLLAGGMAVILDLHWTAPGSTLATKQLPMPDTNHTPTFWTQVAQSYNYSQDILFEVFNEPFPGNAPTGTADAEWACWATGGSDCTADMGVSYGAAGMASLMKAVRDAGAHNIMLVGALAWSNNLNGWLAHVPADPLGNTAAVWHSYDFNSCNDVSCWDSVIAPVAEKYPVVVTECGFKVEYAEKLWPWLESKGINYLAWVWNVWGNDQSLIASYDGTPNGDWGNAYKTWLAGLHAAPAL